MQYIDQLPPHLKIERRDAHTAGIIVTGMGLYVVLGTIGVIILVVRDAFTQSSLSTLLTLLAVAIWMPASVLCWRELHLAMTINVFVAQPEPAEVIRFIRVNAGVEPGIDVRDVAYLLRHFEVDGRLGKNAIRGLRFPTGRLGSDTYHDILTRALADMGWWRDASGRGMSPALLVDDFDEAYAVLGVAPPPYPVW